MLDDRPILPERVAATATFAAIAIGTLAALDFIVTGGFDFGARRTASTYGIPLIGAASTVTAEPAPSTVTALTWSDPELAAEEETDELIDAAATPDPGEGDAAPSEDQLYGDVARLDLEEDAAGAGEQSMETPGAEDAPYGGADGAQALFDERDLRPDPNAPDSDF